MRRRFCVHYVTTTEDAPAVTDLHGADGTGAPKGVPDYVDELLREFEHVGEVEQAPAPTGQGWNAPVPDGTAGGGVDQFDVYIAEIGQDCCFGYANPEAVDGSNQWPAYMVMDDDYALDEFDYPDPTAPLQVTAAREHNHVLQFAIDVRFDAWIGEAVATWNGGQDLHRRRRLAAVPRALSALRSRDGGDAHAGGRAARGALPA